MNVNKVVDKAILIQMVSRIDFQGVSQVEKFDARFHFVVTIMFLEKNRFCIVTSYFNDVIAFLTEVSAS